ADPGPAWWPPARPPRPDRNRRRTPPPPGSAHADPRYVPSAASTPARIRPRNTARHPGPPQCFYYRPPLPPPLLDRRVVAFGRMSHGYLHTPAQPVQQRVDPANGVRHPKPRRDHLHDPRQRPTLILHPTGLRRPSVQHRLQLAQLSVVQLAFGAAGPLGLHRFLAAFPPRLAPPVRRHLRHPKLPRD